jgi:hypothetical protein
LRKALARLVSGAMVCRCNRLRCRHLHDARHSTKGGSIRKGNFYWERLEGMEGITSFACFSCLEQCRTLRISGEMRYRSLTAIMAQVMAGAGRFAGLQYHCWYTQATVGSQSLRALALRRSSGKHDRGEEGANVQPT